MAREHPRRLDLCGLGLRMSSSAKAAGIEVKTVHVDDSFPADGIIATANSVGADLIVMGPGSLYTSILPNLLVPDLAEALRHARAPKTYICNLATQPGETDNYTVADHVATLFEHISTGCLDLVIANDNLSIPPDRGGGHTIYVQLTPPENLRMQTADLVDEARPWRHDGAKLAQVVMRLLS